MHFWFFFFFSSRRRHTRWPRDWSSDVCSSDLPEARDRGGHVLPLEAEVWRPGRERAPGVAPAPGRESPLEGRGRRSHAGQANPAGVLAKKIVTPAQRRSWVTWVREVFRVSTRRACRATGVWRSLLTYQSTRPPQDALRRRLRELAAVRVSYGYRRLHTVLRREGWAVNPKRIYRLYCAEALQLRRKRPRRRRSAVPRGPRRIATQPNEVWAMDFMHDTLADGRLVRVLTLIDSYTRESLALVA